MKQNIILEKTYNFAVRVVKLHIFLCKTTNLYEVARQLLKCGTSIGANTEEAIGGESRKDFIHKLSIAYKEARETRFWLRVLRDAEVLEPELATSMLSDCEEILAIIGKIKITTTKNMT